MKLLVAFALCLSVAAVLAGPKEEIEQKLKNAHEKCQTDPTTAVDEAELKAYREEKAKAPANIGPHSLCVSKTLGWQKADGSVDKDYIKQRVSVYEQDAAKVDSIVAECSTAKDSDIETARHIVRCLISKAESN